MYSKQRTLIMARKYISIASFNTKNLVSPETIYYGKNKYTQRAYEQKLDWLAEQLFRMNGWLAAIM